VAERRLVVFVAGTGTGVGKTYVGAALARALLGAGYEVAARKPVQSFGADDGPTDAEVLAAATGEQSEHVCPPELSFPLPYAPPMAAEALGRGPLTLAEVLPQLPARGIVMVEGVGGPRSPVADDGDNLDLCRAVGAQLVVLVADAGLGTLNATRLSVPAFGDVPVIVQLNRFDPDSDLHRRNLAWLRERAGYTVTTTIEALAGELIRRAHVRTTEEVG
jgi:dethiobiotin synthetase